MKNNQKGFANMVLIAIVLGIIVLAGGAYFVMRQNATPQVPVYQDQANPPDNTQTNANTTVQNQPAPQTPLSETANWKTYKNIKYNFEFRYPPDWDLESLDYIPVPHQPSQLGVSMFFKPPGTMIVLNINFFDSGAQTEEMINTSKGYFRKLADNGKNVLTAHLKTNLTVDYEIFKQDYETILSTFKFMK